jgi:hypothetical protein
MRKTVGLALAVAVALSVAFLLAPPMGTDLSAQVARADFVRDFGGLPVDFRWYGGTDQFGYSLISPAVMAAISARWLGALAAVVATGAFAYVLVRTGARRPMLGAIIGALCLVGNIVSGRITFAFGIAFGMLALAVITSGVDSTAKAGAVAVTTRWPRWVRLVVIALLGVLATLASPVAGLFAGVTAGAVLLAGARRTTSAATLVAAGANASPRADSGTASVPTLRSAAPTGAQAAPVGPRWRIRGGAHTAEALALGLGAALGLVPTTLFSDAGTQLFTADAMRVNVALAVVVIALVPGAFRPVRVGAALAIALLLIAYYVPSAIGSNAIRLTMLFALPVVAAFTALPKWPLIIVIIALVWWQDPVMTNDIAQAGSLETEASFYQPLLAEVGTLGPLGRIEVVPLRDHWESSYVANAVPLARGWERQVDVVRNPLFYDNALTASSYGAWLRSNAVSYVAIAPGQPFDVYARSEATVVGEQPAYLRLVWQNRGWRLYAVNAPQPFVTPGTLVSSGADRVVFKAIAGGDVTVRVRWSRWLTIDGGDACVTAAPGGWTTARVPGPGTYTLSSAVLGVRQC